MSFDYEGGRWKAARTRALRRDKWRCRNCARYGKRVEATHVHHIWPAEDFPEYAWARWNLIALSVEAHNMMHDRTTGKLTAVGERLRRKTIPPSPPR